MTNGDHWSRGEREQGRLVNISKPGLREPMIIYDELKNDHEAVKEMMTHIVEMSSRASTSKIKLFKEMKTVLTAHVRAEEKVFYGAIKQEKSAHDAALEGYEEHHVADLLMREISQLAPNDEKWKAKFAVLKENVEHHVEEEEGEIWDKAREILDETKALELGEKFIAEKEKLLAKAAS
jgi:hemerythrin superfamily protein